jgi:hypothetical protein
MVIATRDQLAGALTVAAELEHGLLIQYLFAAYSLKKSPAEGITAAQADTCRIWEGRILQVARDEMAHLANVCNLLSAIGEAPHLLRPNFPQQVHPSLPFVFELTKFSEKTLYRFARAEAPDTTSPQATAVAGQSNVILFHFTGELYRQIKEGIDRVVHEIGESRLFIGPQTAQDVSDWSNRFRIPPIGNQKEAVAAIDAIVLQGEGSPGNTKLSHFAQFEQMRDDLAVQKQADATFRPARWVAPNPRLDDPLFGAGPGTLIADPVTHEIAHVFNSVYHTVLLMLMQYYSFGGERADQIAALREAIRTSMSMAIRPIAEILTVLPVGGGSPRTAGACFDILTEPRLSTQPSNRWAILDERFAGHVATADALSKTAGSPPVTRLAFVAQNLSGIAANLRAVAS